MCAQHGESLGRRSPVELAAVRRARPNRAWLTEIGEEAWLREP